MSFVLHPLAEADIASAHRWYESKRQGLGVEFVNAVDLAFQRIEESPLSFPVAYRTLRRTVLRRFPYVIYFRASDARVEVFAVLHGRRDRKTLVGR